jgi:ABC-type sugar transport system permease subunit
MCNKIFGGLVVLVAIGMALMVNFVSIDNIDGVMRVFKFFDAMIPVLAAGALIKFLFWGKKGCGACGKENCACK